MPRGKRDRYKSLYEGACVTIVELQQALERERAKRRATERRATIDELTRLLTRRAFDLEGKPRFRRALRGSLSVAMVFVDANDFKRVNDTFGHATGDALLIAIARAIKQSKRPADLAGRKGGDEFVLFFDKLDMEGAQAVARRLYEAVSAIRLDRAPDLRASVSIGVAVGVPPSDLDWKGLIAQADAAMYEAKKLRGTDRPTICIQTITT